MEQQTLPISQADTNKNDKILPIIGCVVLILLVIGACCFGSLVLFMRSANTTNEEMNLRQSSVLNGSD